MLAIRRSFAGSVIVSCGGPSSGTGMSWGSIGIACTASSRGASGSVLMADNLAAPVRSARASAQPPRFRISSASASASRSRSPRSTLSSIEW